MHPFEQKPSKQMAFVKPKADFKIYGNFNTEEEKEVGPTLSKFILTLGLKQNLAHKTPAASTQKQSGGKVKRICLADAIVRPAYKEQSTQDFNSVLIKETTSVYPDEEFHVRNEIEYCGSNQQKASKWVTEALTDSIIETVFYFADNGDIQSSAIMLLVFKSKVAFPAHRMNSVLRLYVSMLQRMEASVLACEVIKFCNINDIQEEYGKASLIKTK